MANEIESYIVLLDKGRVRLGKRCRIRTVQVETSDTQELFHSYHVKRNHARNHVWQAWTPFQQKEVSG